MIWCCIISLILIILQIGILKSCKISDGYRYNEQEAKYIKIPIWVLIIAFVILIIPYVNVFVPIITLILVSAFVIEDDSIRFVPKGNTILGKIMIFLTKEV